MHETEARRGFLLDFGQIKALFDAREPAFYTVHALAEISIIYMKMRYGLLQRTDTVYQVIQTPLNPAVFCVNGLEKLGASIRW